MKVIEPKTPYFAEKEEQAVINYINSDSLEEKNKIYNEILIEPFRKMIESILRRYPIHIGNYDMNEVESNALTHLIEHMVKYKPYIIERKFIESTNEKWFKLGLKYRFIYFKDANEKLNEIDMTDDGYIYRIFKSRAFSYCQTIIRNYYKDHSKKSYNEKKINLNFDDYVDEINDNIEHTYEMEMENQHQLENLINGVVKKIEDRIDNDPVIKKNEILVGDAIANVLKNWQILFMEDSPQGRYEKRVTNKFAKNKILLYLKEQTGLNTKEIRIGIKPFKEIYFIEKLDYMED
ncbi:MAG: hypothetical protein DRN27_10160 [Thermoplasmata archaeon]|nr:MAG: hypothetical protein DRN27_10160 [Thermoplasmata archaeon]